jgi:3D (Asp-Asp-Asp) domain-containing protein
MRYGVCALMVFILLAMSAEPTDMLASKPIYKPPNKVIIYKPIEKPIEKPKESGRVLQMEATAYDLSIQCCGKSYNHPSRGIAASGKNLNNATRHEMIVASNDFKMGTKLELTFAEPYQHYSGVYTVADTGGMRRGVIDVFVGDHGETVSREAIEFGRRAVQVTQIKE